MKLLNSVRLVTLASAAVLVGCQDTDYDFEKNYISEDAKAFIEAFEDRYGYIDPTHTFNDAYYGSVEVTTDESAVVTVSAFIDSQTEATILAQAVVKGTQTIEYDYPNGTARVFVIAKCNGQTDGTVMAPGKDGKASFSFAETRAKFSSVPAVQETATLVKTVEGFYTTTDGKTFTQHTSTELPGLYNINEWTGRFYTTSTPGDLAGDYSKSSLSESMLTTLATYCTKVENSTALNYAAQNISFQVTASGPISLTGVSCTTNSPNAIGYFFTDANHNTLADFQAADKFILIPKTSEGSVTGNKYYLTYYPSKDSNGNPTGGTHIIPEGTIVHFFLIRHVASTAPYLDTNGDLHLYGDLMFGSEPEITKITTEGYNKTHVYTPYLTDLATTASFTYQGIMCLGFEDWPQNGMRDWNDCVFTLDGNITNGEETKTKKMNVFTVAVEDLGVADDTDYNDVVFTVSQEYNVTEDEDGKQTITYQYPKLTFLCAGGTLPLRIYYKDESNEVTIVDEIHKAFHKASGIESDNTEYMINTGGDGASTTGTIVTRNTFTEELVVESFKTEPLKMSKHASYFYIEITKKDGTKLHVNAKRNDTENDSNYPFVLVIPTDSWEFPKERVNIDLIYNGFKDWVNSQNRGYFWYNSDAQKVQAAESALLDGASSTLSVETTSTSTSDLKYGDNDLATTLDISPTSRSITYPFMNWNFLRQTDNLTYTMLYTINNSKSSLDIETWWENSGYGTLSLTSLDGKTVNAGSVTTDGSYVKFSNVPVADIMNGFKIKNTVAEYRLQSMTLTLHYKDAETYKLEADGEYTYIPVPEFKEIYDKWDNSTGSKIAYKINYTTDESLSYVIKVEGDWTYSNGIVITDLNGKQISADNYSNLNITDLGLTNGFYILGYANGSDDNLKSLKITVLKAVNVNDQSLATELNIGENTVYPIFDALHTITYSWGGTTVNYAYLFKVKLPEKAGKIKITSQWPDNAMAVLYEKSLKEANAKTSSTGVFELNDFTLYSNGDGTYNFYLSQSSSTTPTMKADYITIKVEEEEEEEEVESGSGDNTLNFGDNTVAVTESGNYTDSWGTHFMYKYEVILPSSTSKIKISSYWTDSKDNVDVWPSSLNQWEYWQRATNTQKQNDESTYEVEFSIDQLNSRFKVNNSYIFYLTHYNAGRMSDTNITITVTEDTEDTN